MVKGLWPDNSNGCHLVRDGNTWCAVGPEFVDLATSPAAFGSAQEEAVRALQGEFRKAGLS
jgi:hypothetical protein